MDRPTLPGAIVALPSGVAEMDHWVRIVEYGGIGVGITLLVLWFCWPEQKVLTIRGFKAQTHPLAGLAIQRTFAGICGLLALLLATAVSQQHRIDGQRGFIADRNRKMEAELRMAIARGPQAREELLQSYYLYIPKGASLLYLTLGNPALAADYLWLTSLQHVSSPFRQGQKFDMLHKFYDGMLDLDPHWVQIYVNTARILSALDPDRMKTERFINRCMVQNPGSVELYMEAGRLFVVPPMDPQYFKLYSTKASTYFQDALKTGKLSPERTAFLSDLIGRLKLEAGFNATAAEYLYSVATDETVPDSIRKHSSQEWLRADSLTRVDRLQEQVDSYKAQTGRWPYEWAELYPGQIPIDTYGLPMLLDMMTGKVISLGERYVRTLQAAGILRSYIAQYRLAHDRYPQDLDTLRNFIAALHPAPDSKPFPLVEAFGEALALSRNPLGQPWDYDPERGEIKLPEKCTPEFLFAEREAAMQGKTRPAFKAQ